MNWVALPHTTEWEHVIGHCPECHRTTAFRVCQDSEWWYVVQCQRCCLTISNHRDYQW